MPSRRHFLRIAGAVALVSRGAALAKPAVATPMVKPARLIVGFPPGGAVDMVARLVADNVKGYASSIIVDNRPGAGGRIALQTLKGAPSDGSVIALTPVDQLALFPHVYRDLGYKPLEDFAAITPVCEVQFLIVVGPRVAPAVRTIEQFVDWCRRNRDIASYGTAGAGTHPHFVGIALAQAAGFEFVHVPYKGGVTAMQDVLGGHLAASIGTVGTFLPGMQSGGLRALATTAPRRSASLPDVPTFREAGYPMLESLEWFGLVAPAGTPADAVDRLDKDVRQVLATDTAKVQLAKLGFEPAPASPSAFSELIASQTRRWAQIVKSSGFRPLD
jgi:tripartite-type tricarboxylate transporter receptor subunit TctC